jgi:hypothetical protein
MAYNFEREGGVVKDVRTFATDFIQKVNDLAAFNERWQALEASFLDSYFEAGNPGAEGDISKQEILDAISSFNSIVQAFRNGLHDTHLHRVAFSGLKGV